ncbi:hypothetical protein Q1695_015185 [Nippostrongylus brasiliensis]|nr:hypothetical protein Q1695_015185 [Nippostrongylus brasiliensis]
MPYYKDDLKVYYNGKEFRGNWSSSSQYIIVIAHGVLIGCFGLLFFLCALSSAIVGSCLQIDLAVVNSSGLEEKTFLFRFLALLHIFWGSALLALCVLGLIDVSWRGEFLGADLLWMVVLFCSTAILGFSNHRTLVSTQLVMNLACLGIAIEKMCASINLIYQFSSYVVYVRGDNHIYISQIVLISVQTGVLAAEVLTALVCSVLLGNELRRQHSFAKQWQSRGTALLCSSTSLFYGVVLTGCYVVFELGKWRYNEVPLEIPFFRLGNGPLALVAFIVQVLSFWMSWLFAVAVVIQILIAALALFTISSAITNVYYMQILLSTTELARTDRQTTIYDVSLILSAGAALACCLATLGGSLYALFYRSIPYEGGPLLAVDGRTESEPSVQLLSPLPTISSPNLVPGQLMEEQTAYCSTDENPFYYHTSRRYYRQPYTVESGFYGYTLTTPRTPQHRDFASSSSQTQIGHVFAEHHKSS